MGWAFNATVLQVYSGEEIQYLLYWSPTVFHVQDRQLRNFGVPPEFDTQNCPARKESLYYSAI
jgi:hypothetical protein